MKKRSNESKTAKGRQNENTATDEKKNVKKGVRKEKTVNDDIENQGFSDWLRSSDGIEMMRLFVIANSILVFVTMGWPKMQEAILYLKDYICGDD
ncbi:hypothetical protein WN55_06399 [Dufourea novaeangliae]|uniref:Transmembrane protein n=1 Tax=Dufourea novaeangliae TaxID=178035 RepID=A0A154NW22_DUFNO|nr:hypothetical protein WN55_06399 [Dufourea novaeangliae]